MKEDRSGGLRMFALVGAVLLLAAIVILASLPIWHCPYCDVAIWWKYNNGMGISGRRDRPEDCDVCHRTGKMSLFRRWSLMQELRPYGLTFPLFR
jgi:hypothetical protein